MYTLFGGYLRYLYYDMAMKQGEYPMIAWLRVSIILAIAISSLMVTLISLVYLAR